MRVRAVHGYTVDGKCELWVGGGRERFDNGCIFSRYRRSLWNSMRPHYFFRSETSFKISEGHVNVTLRRGRRKRYTLKTIKADSNFVMHRRPAPCDVYAYSRQYNILLKILQRIVYTLRVYIIEYTPVVYRLILFTYSCIKNVLVSRGTTRKKQVCFL